MKVPKQHINDAASSQLQLTLSLVMNEAPSWRTVPSSTLEWNEHGGKIKGQKSLKQAGSEWLWLTPPWCSVEAEQNERWSEVMHVGVSWIRQWRKFSLNELDMLWLQFQIVFDKCVDCRPVTPIQVAVTNKRWGDLDSYAGRWKTHLTHLLHKPLSFDLQPRCPI